MTTTTSGTIVVLTTGGTIASAPGTDGRNRSGALAGDELADTLDLPRGACHRITIRNALQKPSNAVTTADLLTLKAECQRLVADADVSGIVLTHGTDTLEDTAWFLDLTVSTADCAVVVTGSQRAPHEPGSDAQRNLRDGVLAVLDGRTQGMGVLVAFNECLYAARNVRKVHSYQLAGFDAPGGGRLGFFDQERLFLEQNVTQALLLDTGEALPRVDILPAYLGADPALLDAALDSGARGLVLDAMGRGHVPPDWVSGVTRATNAGVPVLVTTSCLDGPVHRSYDFPGSLAHLEASGALPAPTMTARKARLKLAVILSRLTHWHPTELSTHFEAASMAGTA